MASTVRPTVLVAVVALTAAGCDEEPTLGERQLGEPDESAEPEPEAEPEVATRDPRCPAASDGEVALALQTETGPSVTAVLCNGTDDAFRYTTRGFSASLDIRPVDGESLEGENRLANRRRRVVVRKQDFTKIEPGEAHELKSLDIEAEEEGGGWELSWFPYRYSNVEPGRYRARARWASSQTETTDGEPIEEAWTGELETRWKPFTLPEPPKTP